MGKADTSEPLSWADSLFAQPRASSVSCDLPVNHETHQIGQKLAGTASFSFEKSGNVLRSPLGPTNGRKSITLTAIYTQDRFKITTGVSYIMLGDAMPETGTPDTARAEMDDTHGWGAGVKFGYSF